MRSSMRVIIAALAGNLAIAVSKFVAAAFTGSAAMLSEAIHSTVDTGNELLLMFGMRRAARPADAAHPFGYGLQLYFWVFVVAVLIFGFGAVFSLIEGIDKIARPRADRRTSIVNYVVLGLAIVFESGSWLVAFREFRKQTRRPRLVPRCGAARTRPSSPCCSRTRAALIGLVIALIGIALGRYAATCRCSTASPRSGSRWCWRRRRSFSAMRARAC